MFTSVTIETKKNLFDELENSTKFEDITNGRKGAVIVDCKNNSVPIVRTTTVYNNPAQKFAQIHYDIISKIKEEFKDNIKFNNALIEIYDSNYCKMGFHTDQSLDLKEDSYICLFSCYKNIPCDKDDIRTLKIQDKDTKKELNIKLKHNSAILFSTSTNQNHIHKIILESTTSKNRWLGITFRLSKTYIKFVHNKPYINNKLLTIANPEERKQFIKYKGIENSTCDFKYPEINFTISISDTIDITDTKEN